MTRKLTDLIADVFGIERTQISVKTSQAEVDNWNSLNTILLVDELEKEYNVRLSIEDVMEITSVMDIKNLLEKHSVKMT